MRADRRGAVPGRPGETSFSLARTRRFDQDPLGLLLECYERYGPDLHAQDLSPQRRVHAGAGGESLHAGVAREELPVARGPSARPDPAAGRRAADDRRRLPPHAPQADAAGLPPRADRCGHRRDAATRSTARWHELEPGEVVDIYDWTRRVALRVAMRALFGIDPDTARAGGLNAAAEFESALSFYARDYLLQIPRGPYTPFWKLMRSRAPARHACSTARSTAAARRASAAWTCSRCCSTRATRRATRCRARHVRDEVMTLLFAGHDTTTSTVVVHVLRAGAQSRASSTTRA